MEGNLNYGNNLIFGYYDAGCKVATISHMNVLAALKTTALSRCPDELFVGRHCLAM